MVENLNILKIFEKSLNLQKKEYLRFVPHFYSGWGNGDWLQIHLGTFGEILLFWDFLHIPAHNMHNMCILYA